MSNSSTEARMLLALQALLNSPKLSVRRAADAYEVPRNTLRRRQNGIQSRRDTTQKSRRLSNLEEEIIVQFILDLDSRGFPPRHSFIEEMANSLLADRNAPLSASAGLITSLNDNQSSRRISFVNMTTRGPNAKIQLLFAIGLTSYRTQSRSMVSNQRISGTLMRLAL
jgi:hypothetical protein